MNPTSFLKQIRMILPVLFAMFTPVAILAEVTNASPIAVWDYTAEISTALGYKDNVLYSSIASESSGFILSSIDASLMRLSETEAYLMLYMYGEDYRYFDAPSVEYEQFLSLTAQYVQPVGDKNQWGALASYLYQHQIFDASETQLNQRRLLVLGHSASFAPHWKHSFNDSWSTRLEGSAFRQMYEVELDNYSEGRAQLNAMYDYGHRSQASFGYEFLNRHYDTREQFDSGGVIISNTDLTFQQHECAAHLKHSFDKNRHWRSSSHISYMLNADNGSGYFDYSRLLFRQQLRFKKGLWDIKTNARFGKYLYDLQTINNETRKRSYAMIDLIVERRLNKYWRIFASAEHEWNMSNDPLDEYKAWFARSGVTYEFK